MIRAALPGEAGALAALLARAPQVGEHGALATDRSADFFARQRAYAHAAVLVDDDPDRGGVCATVTVAAKDVEVGATPVRAGYVFDLAVDPGARGEGRARRLLDAAARWAEQRGAAFLYAHVMEGNAASLATFGRAGYRAVATVEVRVFGTAAGGDADAPPGIEAGGWEPAAAALTAATRGHDLARPRDGGALRAEWERLPGWRPDDVWITPPPRPALLGLWDHSPVARPAGLPLGILLGGAGDPAALARLARCALGRAAARGLRGVYTAADARTPPPWLDGLPAATEPYHLLARDLQGGAADRVGARPVAVDPIDL